MFGVSFSKLKVVGLPILVGMLSYQATAQTGAISSATAGSGRAAIEASESPRMNPGSLGFIRGYHFSSSYSSASSVDGWKGQEFSLGLVDHLPDTAIPSGLGYYQNRRSSDSIPDWTTKNLNISLGNFLFSSVSFGGSLLYREDLQDLERYAQINGDLGALWAINRNVGLALVVLSPFRSGVSFPERMRMKSQVGLGFNLNYQRFFRFKTDLTSGDNQNFQKPIAAMGLES